jgi:class 3 adenylate cyclase
MDTDIRHILPTVRVPTLVLSRTGDQAQPIEGGRHIASKIPGARFVELPGNDAVPWVGDAESVLSEIERYLDQSPGQASGSERRLGTVMFTDIVSSTERSAEFGDLVWKQMLEEHHAILRRAIQHHGGREIATWGDGFFATFDGPAAAARCAVTAATEVRALGLEIRAGVHTGEVETIDEGIGGIGVTIGARIAALAGPSEVLVSSTVKDLTAGSQLIFEDAGEHGLKGVPDRWRLYRVVSESPLRDQP